MTFLNFFKLIHIHPILIIFIAISLLTGTFVHLFILLTIVFIHEIGHYLAAKYFQWRIRSIVLWVFGGVMKTDESGTRPIKEDIIVTVAGPLQHLFIFFMIVLLELFHMLPEPIIQSAYQYNMIILLFNLLPIYPLDGGKLLFFILSYFIPYKQAHRYTILFSILTSSALILVQLFVFSFTLSAILIIVFLLLENRTEWKNHYYIFIRFLLNRLYDSKLSLQTKSLYVPKEYRLMDVFVLFKRNKKYDIYIKSNEKSMTEKHSLSLYFNEKRYHETMEEIMRSR